MKYRFQKGKRKNYYLFTIIFIINYFQFTAQITPVAQYPDNPSGLVFHENTLYISEYDANAISKVNISNGNLPLTPEQFLPNLHYPWGLAINNDYLYTLDNGKLYKINLTTPTPNLEFILEIHAIDLAFNGNNLYMAGGGSIYRVDTSLPTPTKELVLNNIPSNYIGITFKENILYYSEEDTGKIYKLDITNLSTTPTLVKSGLSSPRGLIINGNSLYIAEYSDGYYYTGNISKLDITSSYPIVSIVASGLTGPWNLAINNDELYISEFPISTVSKIAITPILSTKSPVIINRIKIFPNPTNEYLNIIGIKSINNNFRINNILGITIIEGNYSYNEQINIKNLSPGTYFLHINNMDTIKFIKK